MDFKQWLYAHYIKPYLDQCPRQGYETELSLFEGCLNADERAELDRVLEFWGSRAFLLGVKTGAGLREAVCRGG